MKKLILGFGLFLAMTSCKEIVTLEKEGIPSEIFSEYQQEKFDTLLVIREKKKNTTEVHLFRNKTNKPIGSFDTNSDAPTGILFIFLIGIIIGVGAMNMFK